MLDVIGNVYNLINVMNSLQNIGVDYDSSDSDIAEPKKEHLTPSACVPAQFGLVNVDIDDGNSATKSSWINSEQAIFTANQVLTQPSNKGLAEPPQVGSLPESSTQVADIISVDETPSSGLQKSGCVENQNDTEKKPSSVDDLPSSSVDSSSSSDDSSDSESSIACLSDDSVTPLEVATSSIVKTKDEVLPCELPFEDLSISLPEDAIMAPVGLAKGMVEDMMVIEAYKETPPLSHDTVFFTSTKDVVGKVFDVFGPVKHPFYSIRMPKSKADAASIVKTGDEVYYAPLVEDLTQYIFVEKLAIKPERNLAFRTTPSLKRLTTTKGSDASWKFDQEPPVECIEYSDDEQEAKAKASARNEKIKKNPNAKAKKGSNKKPGSGNGQYQNNPRNIASNGEQQRHIQQTSNVTTSNFNSYGGQCSGQPPAHCHPLQGPPPPFYPPFPPPFFFPPQGFPPPPHLPPPSLSEMNYFHQNPPNFPNR